MTMKITLPSYLMLGYWGSAPFPWLLILSSKYKDHDGLIAHEQRHQQQQRDTGWFLWTYRYFTSKQYRLEYEVDAYRAWLDVNPNDVYSVSKSLSTKYGLSITYDDAFRLLTETIK